MKKFTLPKDGGLLEAGLPNGIKHTYERIPAHIYEDETFASRIIAEKIVSQINAQNGRFRLGLTTGSSPVFVFQELVRLYKEGVVSFKDVEVYSIDEYYPAPADSFSRNRRLYQDFIEKVDIKPENVFVPKLTEIHDSAYVSEFCATFDAKATGLDFLVMGTGEKVRSVSTRQVLPSRAGPEPCFFHTPHVNVRQRILPEILRRHLRVP